MNTFALPGTADLDQAGGPGVRGRDPGQIFFEDGGNASKCRATADHRPAVRRVHVSS
jgi:hypothetical protein